MRKIAVPSAILAAVLLAVLGVVLAQDGAVQVSESGFSPQVITVPVRTVVTWTNVGALSHTVTALNGEFSSGILPPGGVYSYFFAAPGEYPYRDLLSSATGAESSSSRDHRGMAHLGRIGRNGRPVADAADPGGEPRRAGE